MWVITEYLINFSGKRLNGKKFKYNKFARDLDQRF